MLEEITIFMLTCDKCGCRLTDEEINPVWKDKDEMIEAAINDGWDFQDDQCLCDECKK